MTTQALAPAPAPPDVPAPAAAVEPEARFVIKGLSYAQYAAIAEALPDRHNPRLVFLDGSLTFLSPSHLHDRRAEHFGFFVIAVAGGLGLACEPAGSTTYRRSEREAGVEGDKVFYFGPNADRMRIPVAIDLAIQPPPDLAIEVEISHPADVAMTAWGRIGVPEVWRFDARRDTLTFWQRQEDATYTALNRSLCLPGLEPSDVLNQLRRVEELGFMPWFGELPDWVRSVIVPRLG